MIRISGRKEVGEAVLITLLCAVANEAVAFAADEIREARERRRRGKKKGKSKT